MTTPSRTCQTGARRRGTGDVKAESVCDCQPDQVEQLVHEGADIAHGLVRIDRGPDDMAKLICPLQGGAPPIEQVANLHDRQFGRRTRWLGLQASLGPESRSRAISAGRGAEVRWLGARETAAPPATSDS